MDRDLFAGRLRAAAAGCRDFALRFLEEDLPPELRFRVHLNSSYDGNPLHADEVVYPEDSSARLGRALTKCTAETVVETLWREGRVPEWINLSVAGVAPDATMIEVLACGRYTANEALLYHAREGAPPFHVLGPTLPVGYREGQRFSIHHRSRCAGLAELSDLGQHAKKVWSLEMIGPEFRGGALGCLREMSNLEILELRDASIDGSELGALEGLPKLRVLRIFARSDSLDVERAPRLKRITDLDIVNPPPRPWGIGAWLSRLPRLSNLRLESEGELFLDGKLPRRLEWLTLSGAQVVGQPRLPSAVGYLSIHLSRAPVPALVQRLQAIKSVESLHLRNTPVDDQAVSALLARWQPRSVDVTDTKVTETFLRRLILANPELRVSPHVDLGELQPEEVSRIVAGQLTGSLSFTDFFGTTPATLHAILVRPHVIQVEDDWGDELKARPMWAITAEQPGGHVVVFDPCRHLWLVATRGDQSWSARGAASNLDGALALHE
jgi:hypothetical protein